MAEPLANAAGKELDLLGITDPNAHFQAPITFVFAKHFIHAEFTTPTSCAFSHLRTCAIL